MTVHDLPAINAALNSTSSILLLTAYIFIKLRKVRLHATFIISALVTSTAFLACYLVYHSFVGATYVDQRFPQVPHSLRTIYKWILFPHLTLAIFMLPLIARSLYLAYHRRWESHRKISPWSFWIWLYVSVTGVIIYWMLYHLFPGMQQSAVAGVTP